MPSGSKIRRKSSSRKKNHLSAVDLYKPKFFNAFPHSQDPEQPVPRAMRQAIEITEQV